MLEFESWNGICDRQAYVCSMRRSEHSDVDALFMYSLTGVAFAHQSQESPRLRFAKPHPCFTN